MSGFVIDQKKIDRAMKLVPAEDLISATRDCEALTPTTDLLLILSTPRSGSTLLSDMIDRTGLCCPAEYFQPYEYLPILASRWNCIRNGMLDDAAFLRQLKRYRTSRTGWLGVKLHPTHLPLFERVRPLVQDLTWHGVHLIRRDQIAQAVSYHIADQTKSWSSAFKSQGDAEYSYTAIRRRLHEIVTGNALLLAAASASNLKCHTIYYEDLAEDPAKQLVRVPGIKFHRADIPQTGLVRQGSSRNRDWAERFSAEYMEEHVANLTGGRKAISTIVTHIRDRWL